MPDIWDVAEREHPSSEAPKDSAWLVEKEPLRVVVDFSMPFASMVGFMVKWVIASIPAVIILVALAAGFWVVGNATMSAFFGR